MNERPVIPPKVEGVGGLVAPAAEVHGVGKVTAPASATAKAYDATVVTKSFTADAVIAAAKAMDEAKTPEELADRMVDYVRKTDGASLIQYLASLTPAELDATLAEVRERSARLRDADYRAGRPVIRN